MQSVQDAKVRQDTLLRLKVVIGNFRLHTGGRKEEYTLSQKAHLKTLYKQCLSAGWTSRQIRKAVGKIKI